MLSRAALGTDATASAAAAVTAVTRAAGRREGPVLGGRRRGVLSVNLVGELAIWHRFCRGLTLGISASAKAWIWAQMVWPLYEMSKESVGVMQKKTQYPLRTPHLLLKSQ